MTRDKLRKLAEAVEVTAATPWYRAGDLAGDGRIQCAEDAAWVIAASPAVVLGLLDDLAAAEAEVARQNAGRDVERNMLWAAVPKLERLAEVEERLAAVREWIDHRGVDVGDRDDEYMRGYRDAQRHALQDAAELRRALDGRADS